jgi:signal transduction histidine kinase
MLLPLWWFVRHVLRPVQDMMKSTRKLAEGSTDARLVAPGAVPELQAFAQAFNDGLDRIDALTSELQSANDNLAHELRTPLARIRGNLEIHHDHSENAVARDAAARGMEEIDRAADLVQTILTTRAGEHKALKLHRETIRATIGSVHPQNRHQVPRLQAFLLFLKRVISPHQMPNVAQSEASCVPAPKGSVGESAAKKT